MVISEVDNKKMKKKRMGMCPLKYTTPMAICETVNKRVDNENRMGMFHINGTHLL